MTRDTEDIEEILEELREIEDDEYEGHGCPELCGKAADLIESLLLFKRAVIGWREFDHPQGFDRFTAQWVADNADRFS